MAARKNNIIDSSTDLTLVLTRIFEAPRKLVFEACSQKKHLDQWMSPGGFTIPSSNSDFHEGGGWHFLLISPKGEHYPMGGIYKKIVPNELIVMTHAWEGDDGKPEHETTLTLRFEDAGEGKTKLTLEQSIFKSVESRDRHEDGWTECIDRLGELLVKLQTKGIS